jgi:bacillithiol biosynthesis deacetylase BshB1
MLVAGEVEEVDILAIGPHPDDIEIGAGGSLLCWGEAGKRIGLVDLTRGELGTKGDAETRLAESAEAAKRLGAVFRWNLSLTDGAVRDDAASRQVLVHLLRLCRPTWVLCNLEESHHPDHGAGARLVQAAFFLSRLPKFFPDVSAHSPFRLLHYLIHTQTNPSFFSDISGYLDKKLEAMSAYQSQFISPQLPEGYRHTGLSNYLKNVRALNEAFGAMAETEAAEAFVGEKPLAVRSLVPFERA